MESSADRARRLGAVDAELALGAAARRGSRGRRVRILDTSVNKWLDGHLSGRPREFDRDQALDRAMQLFWRRGYEKTSMSDLTEALGIGRQSLYGAFGDKRALFVECLERYTDDVLERTVIAPLDAPGSGLTNVRRTLDAWQAYAESDAFQGCLLGNSLAELGMQDPDLDRVIKKKLDRLRAAFERALARAKTDGELGRGTDAAALARSLTAFAQGAAMVAKVWREKSAIRDTLAGAHTLIDAHVR